MKIIALQKSMIVPIIVLLLGLSSVPSIGGTISVGFNDVRNFSTVEINDDGNIIITVQNQEDLININYIIDDFDLEEVSIEGVEYFRIILEDESNIFLEGRPDLPNICRSIVIPDTQKMGIKVTKSEFIEYEDIQIAPSKGHIPRSIDPEDIPYEFDLIYSQNNWFPEAIAELGEPYILRDFRGQVVKINPFQYNPAEEKLRFYQDITIEIFPVGVDSVNCLDRAELPANIDSDFLQIYENHFINFGTLSYNPVEEQGNMLVITFDSFWDAMMPFVQWKNLKGIPTEMVNVSEIGSANDIKDYIEDYYNEQGLTFVLVVGDAAQVPTLYQSGGASDPSYSYVVGSDHYPDLFVGRFSAQNTQQVETQVERSIEYERDPQTGENWYHQGTGIGSDEGPGDDMEYDWEHIRNIRTDLIGYTYSLVDELYDGTHGGEDAPGNPSSAMVSTAVNGGRSVINYCGHGWYGGWASSGFSIDYVHLLTNENMLPFIWSVACNNGEFDGYSECFAEAWLRATHNGEPSGAVATFMSSVGQYWDPPMAAQDEMVDLLVESYQNNRKTTFGGLSFNGCMLMNDEYGESGWDMTDTWHVFGDPSLQVRTDTPEEITVTHNPTIPVGSQSFDVEVPGIENALCALTRDYNLLGYAYTDETGHAVIEFEHPINDEGDPYLVVTAYNVIPYMTSIEIEGTNEPPEKPQRPSGPGSGKPGIEYTFTTSAVDPEDNQVYYLWDWGDGNFSDWLGPYDSQDECQAEYTWEEKGTYAVKVKARDALMEESLWSDPLSVEMPTSFSFFNFFEKLLPRLFNFLTTILEILQN